MAVSGKGGFQINPTIAEAAAKAARVIMRMAIELCAADLECLQHNPAMHFLH